MLCPICQSPLIEREGKFTCQNGGHTYGKNEGIIQLIGNTISEERYFPDNVFEQLYQSEERNFWFQVRNKIIKNCISQHVSSQSRILEVGCGTGFVSRYLKKCGFHLECADIFFDALQFCKKRDSGDVYYQYNLTDRIFFEEFIAICAFDVLEHIEDDNLVLKNMYDALKPGGFIFITVPADMRLWSPMDVFSEHKRRYSAQELEVKLKLNTFTIIKMSYFMTFLFPLLLFLRKYSFQGDRMDGKRSEQAIQKEMRNELQPSRIMNILFYIIFNMEVPLIRVFNSPFGSSLLCIAQKEGRH
jgi:2-polyprenyl-3-methyl-5-hydroxy-6-metoxy-1,4-benzoquinol methylase